MKLPSLWDMPDIGEVALKSPMPYDTIEPVAYDKCEAPLYKPELKQRSATRIAADPEFRWILDDIERTKKRIAENKVSLNEKIRRTELDEDKARKEQRTAARAKLKPAEEKVYEVTLDNATAAELQIKKEKKPAKETAAAKDDAPKVATADDEEADVVADEVASKLDPIRSETVNILTDLIELSRHPPATASSEKNTAATKH